MAPQPLEPNFVKISCGSTQTVAELFGLGGAYQGAETPSELNKFIVENRNRCVRVRTLCVDGWVRQDPLLYAACFM